MVRFHAGGDLVAWHVRQLVADLHIPPRRELVKGAQIQIRSGAWVAKTNRSGLMRRIGR
jgi:hypothetical protein